MKEPASELIRCIARAKAWGAWTWFRLMLYKKAPSLNLYGPQATGKTQFVNDLRGLGLVKEGPIGGVGGVKWILWNGTVVVESNEPLKGYVRYAKSKKVFA